MQMRRLVLEEIKKRFPITFNPSARLLPGHGEEQDGLLDHILRNELDALLTGLLRKDAFVRFYFRQLELVPEERQTDVVLLALHEVEFSPGGAFAFGDAAYLKMANNEEGRLGGDAMLTLIAMAIEKAGFKLYGRFRDGDEFVAYAESEEAAHDACAAVQRELSNSRICGLPLRVDFGVVSHQDAARTLRRVLESGWEIPEGRSARQVFFDTILGMAEVRSGVIKIQERVVLLTDLRIGLLRSLFRAAPWKWRKLIGKHNELWNNLVRGGKFFPPPWRWVLLDPESLFDESMDATLAYLRSEFATTDPLSQAIVDDGEWVFEEK